MDENREVNAGDHRTMAIIAVSIPYDPVLDAMSAQFPAEYRLKDDGWHITLMLMGDVSTIDFQETKNRLAQIAADMPPIVGNYNGVAYFTGDNGNSCCPVVLLYDSPELHELHRRMQDAFPEYVDMQNHGFTPHTTIAYVPSDKLHTPNQRHLPHTLVVDNISLYYGDDVYSYRLNGAIVQKQLPIDDASIQRLVAVRIGIFNDFVTDIAQQLYEGSISIGQWEDIMRMELKKLHSAAAAIGRGGWDNMSFRDWGRTGPIVKKQYQYLHGFAQDIAANRDSIPLGTLQARARMYGNAAASTAMLMHASYDIISQLPYVPRDGSTECFFWSDKVRVQTQDRGWQRLSSVKKGEFVLTHRGRFMRVIDNWSKEVQDVNSVELSVHVPAKIRKSYRDIQVCTTPDHLFMDDEGKWVRADSLSAGSKLARMGRHNDDDPWYCVGDAVVTNVNRVVRNGTIRCLVVASDESFAISRGLVSHNCLTNCHCRWVLNIVGTEHNINIVEATWELGAAEHCMTCVDRIGKTVTLRLDNSVHIPPYIGGY